MPSSGPPCCSPATAPSSGRRGRVGADPHKVWVLVRGRAEQRRLAITSQRIPAPGAADTGGTPSGTKPRRWARTLTPRSPPRARHPLIRAAQSRGEYQRLAPPGAPPRRPHPRAASAPISQTCARRRRRPPPTPPTLCWARAGRTPSREAEAHAVRRRRSNHSTEKTWSPRAARARATRRRPARSAAAASRPTRSRPTRPSAPRGPLGKTSPRPRNLPRRRTPTRPSLGGDVEELTEQEYR